jgi:anti-anti-sigma regulatory factor
MFTLPTQLTIVQSEEFKITLLQLMDNNDVIELDDSQVTVIDTIGVQLLLALVTDIASQNKKLIWNSSSNVIKESVKQLGLNEAILNQYLNG